MIKTLFKSHKVNREDRGTQVYVDKSDHIILKVYKGLFKSTLIGALHILIGVGARCFEEKHDQEIRHLNRLIRVQRNIIASYAEKYGQLRREG